MGTWTQAICEACWIEHEGKWEPAPEKGEGFSQLLGVRNPVRLVREDLEIEMCSWCGQPTIWGVYKRADPKTVPFPRGEPIATGDIITEPPKLDA